MHFQILVDRGWKSASAGRRKPFGQWTRLTPPRDKVGAEVQRLVDTGQFQLITISKLPPPAGGGKD